MIIVDTTVLVYAVGTDHPLRDPCRRLVSAVASGRIQATTTVEVIQELVHVRARRRPRADAARLGRDYVTLLAPLLRPTGDDVMEGLALFETSGDLGAFDAVLVAATARVGADALVSADEAFATAHVVRHVSPIAPDFEELIRG